MSQHVKCEGLPCTGVNHDCYLVPDVELDPADREDYCYANGDPLFLQTTLQAFNDAGASVSSLWGSI